MSILVFGESLVDIFEDGRTVLGGAPFNTARAAALLGAQVSLATTLSTDTHGDQLNEALQAAGVNLTHNTRSSLPTAQVRVRGEPPAYEFQLTNTASLEFPILVDRTQPSFVSYGSVAAFTEPFATPLAEYLAASRALHYFDPNIRASAFAPTFSFTKSVHALARFADIIRLSEEDLAHLPVEAPQEWLAGRTQAVIITRGEHPASVLLASGIEFSVSTVSAPNFVDSVGAGDTVNGALLAQLQHHDRVPEMEQVWRELLQTAFTAAALTCSRTGANPPNCAELAEFTQTLSLS